MQTSITPIHGDNVSPFDEIKKTDDQGGEYWSARDLAPLMGYPRYDHFQTPLRRAMKSAEVQGIGVEENFPRSREVSKTRGPGREDVHLTRFAAYLVAMNGDPNKPEVAAAQAYFAVRTRQAEVAAPTIETILSDPDSGIRMLEALKDERAAREASEKRAREIEELRAAEEPKRRFADAVASAKNSMLIGEFAKILRANGVPMGQQRLFQWLRDQGLLCRQRGGLWNTPTQRAMELGLFDVKETVVQHASGDTTVRRTPKLTGRGQVYLAERLLPGGDVEVA